MGSLDENVSIDFVIFHALNAMMSAIAHVTVMVISAKYLILLSYPFTTQLMGHMFKSFTSFAAKHDRHSVLCMLAMPMMVIGTYSATAQCANFGAFNIGDDVEITCTDSCITLFSPSIASVAASGSDYEIEEIEYALPYPFNQGAVAISTGDDDFAAATNVPIGFTFNFYGNDYTQCRISPNGWISFDLSENAPYNPPGTIPGANMPLNSIMPVYSDLNPSTCGNVRYDTYGVAPCREFVVSFNAVCQFSCSSNQVSAEIVLYEGTDAIEIYLGNRPTCGWGNASVGIQNANGTQGLSPEGFNTGNWSASNEAWRFASSEVVEGTTMWYEGDSFLGIGNTLDFCSGQSTTVTGWFSQLPVGSFCTEFDVVVSSAGGSVNNNQIDWAIVSENGATMLSDDAPFTGAVCLQNGCYSVQMFDSGGNGWGAADLTITDPEGNEIGSFTLEDGESGVGTFCIDQYDGPEPLPEDYVQVVSDDLEVTAVSDVNAEFDWETPICSGGEPFVLTPVEGSGQWEVDCDGCFDEETLTIDPGIAGSGWLQITHVLDGSCFADVEASEIFISATPEPVFTASSDALCNDEIFDFNATPPFGTWSASCGDCIIANTGVFFAETAEDGLNTVTFTTLGVCPGVTTIDVGVSELLEGSIAGPSILCEDDSAIYVADVPGYWTSNCVGCIDSLSGVFNAQGSEPDTYTVTFTPDSYCPVGDEIQVSVNQSVAIGASNVPASFCETADDFQFNVNVQGGTWSSTCGACLDSAGLFDVGGAPVGMLPIQYTIANGACADTAYWTVDVRPVLEGTFDELGAICQGSEVDLQFAFDADIPDSYSNSADGAWSSSDCPNCILNQNSGLFAGNDLGLINVEYTFDHPCSQSIQGSVVVAPAVDASIVPLPELCESGDLVILEAAGAGGVWSSDCDDCLIGDAFDPASGAGTYEIVYTIDDVCTDQDAVEVIVVPQRDAVINLPDWVCLALEGLQPGVEWPNGVWSANCDGCLSESGTIDLMAAGIGVLEVTHVLEGLCGDSDQVQLEIVGCDIELVNVFSPNGDEINDELEFKYLESFPGNRLTIYDRWGGLVLDRFNYGNNWRAEGVAEGTYYYILSVPNKQTMRGSFMILR